MKKITKDTKLGDIMQINPEAGMVLFEYGLHCIGCGFSAMETLEQGCLAHGMSEKEIQEILKRVNKTKETEKKPEKNSEKKIKEKVEIKKLPKKDKSIKKIKGMIE